jgi:nicotinamide riboside kinase
MEKIFNFKNMKSTPAIFVVTGAESTGKSAVTEWLAKYYNVPYIPEFARSYVEKLKRPYTYKDVEIIASTQIKEIAGYMNSNYPFIFVDTWLIITKVWFEVVFGKSPLWLEDEIKKYKINIFLVCDIDLPWVPDPIRENGGEKRIMLQNRYIEIIEIYGFDYKIVSGINEDRFINALNIIEERIK